MRTPKRFFNESPSAGARAFWLIPVLLMIYSAPLCGQYNNWREDEQPEPLTAFDRHYQDAVTAIRNGNMAAARKHLDAAGDEAASRKDKEGRRIARSATRRLKSLYTPLYDHLAKGDELLWERSWKAAQAQFEAGKELLDKYRETDLAGLENVDRMLRDRVEQEVRRAENQRLARVQEHFRLAEQGLTQQEYDLVLSEMQATRSLLFEEREARELQRVQGLENRARYQQLMNAGQQAADNEDFRAALTAYSEAENIMDSYELQEKKKAIAGRLHYNLLRQGQEAYLGGSYEAAAAKLSEAAALLSSATHQRIVQNAYGELKARGDAAMENKNYDTAEQWYRYAQLFADSPEIQEDLLRAESAADYDDRYTQALGSIDAGKLKRARRQLRRAIRQAPREEARQLIAEIDLYFEKIKSGKRLLNGAPADAWQQFKEAKDLFATDEIEQWMYKARDAAGGQVGELDPEDFYN